MGKGPEIRGAQNDSPCRQWRQDGSDRPAGARRPTPEEIAQLQAEADLELRGTWTGTTDEQEYVVHADGTCSLGLVQRAENISLASDGTVSMGRIYRGEELQYDGQVRS